MSKKVHKKKKSSKLLIQLTKLFVAAGALIKAIAILTETIAKIS